MKLTNLIPEIKLVGSKIPFSIYKSRLFDWIKSNVIDSEDIGNNDFIEELKTRLDKSEDLSDIRHSLKSMNLYDNEFQLVNLLLEPIIEF